ncbi:MAG: RNA polymerase sporulation sigma factor SigK [Lachnospiraceae bacterium]|nr:RNA polymerase sporulation sigma factor SigK [Lachnospiraceae bacterium]
MLLGIFGFVFMCSYVSGTGSFPKPLSVEEEKKYIKEYENGSEEAKNILIERNLRLVAHIVKKYSQYNKDTDDLISVGTIGLIKGITSFDSSRNIRLATYAARCIENEILMNLRYSKKSSNEVFLQEPIGKDRDGNEISMMDIISAENFDIDEKLDTNAKIKLLYEKMGAILKEREKIVIIMRYGLLDGEERTQKEIAKILGISRSYVSRIEKKALKKLFAEMSK